MPGCSIKVDNWPNAPEMTPRSEPVSPRTPTRHAHVGVDLTDSRQAGQRLASAKKPGGGGRHPRVQGEDAAQLDPPRRLVANP